MPAPTTTGRRNRRTSSSSSAPERSGPPRVFAAHDVRVGGIVAGLPPLDDRRGVIAAGASVAAWEELVDAALEDGADAVLLTGRVLAAAADLRAESSLRDGLDRLAAAKVAAFAVTGEPLPAKLALTVLDPAEPSETELARGGPAVTLLRVCAGDAAFPVPDGLPVLAVATGDAAADGCDLLLPIGGQRSTVREESRVVHRTGPLPGGGAASLLTLPETAGGGGAEAEDRPLGPLRLLERVADLPDPPDDVAADLRRRDAADDRRDGEKLRVVRWTLRVGSWGDGLLDDDAADELAAKLGGKAAVHTVTAVPHPDRFGDADGDDGEAATFLETLSHFDPLGDDGEPLMTLADLVPDPDRVRELATRFAAPLLPAA